MKKRQSAVKYRLDRILSGVRIEDAEMRIRDTLKARGFGILTEIDVQKTMKQKIGVDLDAHRIFDARNPSKADPAISSKPQIGATLACKVIQRSVDEGTEICANYPFASLTTVDNPDLIGTAEKVRERLK